MFLQKTSPFLEKRNLVANADFLIATLQVFFHMVLTGSFFRIIISKINEAMKRRVG